MDHPNFVQVSLLDVNNSTVLVEGKTPRKIGKSAQGIILCSRKNFWGIWQLLGEEVRVNVLNAVKET